MSDINSALSVATDERDSKEDSDSVDSATGGGASSSSPGTLLAVGTVAGAAAILAGASRANADVLRSVKGLFHLDPLVANFAFEMEELESEFFTRASFSDTFNKLSEREQDAINLMAREDRDHFELIGRLRKAKDNEGDGRRETPNASATRRPGNFHFGPAFDSREKLMATALDIKETVLYAYHGAVDLVDKDTLMLAAAIAGVEGRHLAVLRELNGLDPVPAPFEGNLQSGAAGNRLSKYGFNGGGYGGMR